MARKDRTLLLAYGSAVAVVLVATAARVLLDPLLSDRLPFLTLFAAVAVTARYAGFGPSLLALGLGALTVAFFVLEPRYSFVVHHPEYRIGLVLYLLIGVGAALLFESLRKAQHRAEVSAEEAHRTQQRLEKEIEQRQQAEAELRWQGEQRFRQLADALPQIVWTARPDGSIDYYNERWYEYTGCTRGDYGEASWEQILHPDDVQRCKDTYYNCIQTGQTYQIEYRFKDRRTGGSRWFLGRAYPERDDAHRIVQWFGTCTDIDDTKRLEEEVRAAESRIRSIINNVIDGIITIGEEGVVETINPAVERLFGYTAQEVVGQNVRVLMPDPYRSEHDGYLPNYLRTGEEKSIGIGREVLGRRKNGSTFPMDLAVGEFRLGGRRFFTGVVRDISQRKRDEATLRKQNERLRLLWEAAAGLLTAAEPNIMLRGLFDKIAPHMGLDIYFNFMVNDAGDALRLDSCIGISEETARSIYRLEFGQAVCGAVAVCRQPIVATFIQHSEDPKVQLVKSFGIRTYVCNPLMAEGRLLGTLSFASRSREQFDADELEFLRTITHYVTVAYERLRLVKELKDTDRRKDEFLAMLAHELRNPLAPIRNAVQVLRLRPAGTGAGEGQGHD